jgi:hypothetical protein
MDFIIKNIRWVMLVSGVLTFTMFYGLFAPQAALESMFGVSFNGTLESIIIRSWCALVGLIGAILIYGALNDKSRVFSISVATVSKAIGGLVTSSSEASKHVRFWPYFLEQDIEPQSNCL